MKKLICVLAIQVLSLPFIICANASDCPNFSGNYKWVSDDQLTLIELSVTQDSCQAIHAHYTTNGDFTTSEDYILDGQQHLALDNGDFKVLRTSTLVDGNVTVTDENHDSSGDKEEIYYTVDHVKLDSVGNISVVRENLDSQKKIVDSDSTLYKKK